MGIITKACIRPHPSPTPLRSLTRYALCAPHAQGNLTFDPAKDITLTASYIIVANAGRLMAGTPDVPRAARATIVLAGGEGRGGEGPVRRDGGKG